MKTNSGPSTKDVKIHGGDENAKVSFGGDREGPGGDPARMVSNHNKALAIHNSKGKGTNSIEARAPKTINAGAMGDCGPGDSDY